MGRSPFPEISCVLCNSPVDLRVDLCADENGKSVHEECYVKRITSFQNRVSRLLSLRLHPLWTCGK
jgi:hypothetical protein